MERTKAKAIATLGSEDQPSPVRNSSYLGLGETMNFARSLTGAGLVLWRKAAVRGLAKLRWHDSPDGWQPEVFEVEVLDAGREDRAGPSMPTVVIGHGLTLDMVRGLYQREADVTGLSYFVSDGNRRVATIRPKRKSAADRTKSAGRA